MAHAIALVDPSVRKLRRSEAALESPAGLAMPTVNLLSNLDRTLHAATAPLTGGLAPSALAAAYFDWMTHLAAAPGKQIQLASQAARGFLENLAFASYCAFGVQCDPCQSALPQDNRFRAPEWSSYPFNVYAQAFLSTERWWEATTTGVHGLSKQHGNIVTFAARQLLDMVAPSNFIWTNPEVLARTRSLAGVNLVRGSLNLADDLARAATGQSPAGSEAFVVGKTVAATPGKVVCRTPLAEIVQYAAVTETVRPEPIVIVPAWIMKYYILDLSPANSLVKFLTEQGFTVFMISWKNPDSHDRDIGFDDYRTLGVLPAIEAATAITGSGRVHAAGYCLGGTLLAVTAAAMERDHDKRLASLSFLASEVDFSEAGELMLFINESQVAFLEDMMWDRGYLDSKQMAGAFQLLRSNDLIWSHMVHDYMMGERSIPIDLMVWNADATRMPYKMHSEYLRSLFFDNDLAEGRFKVGGAPIALHDIRTPVYAVATEQDHVAPWHSVYKFHLLLGADVTFALTNGGHNAGILSEPGHLNRHFRMGLHQADARYVDPDNWMKATPPQAGSWWPTWTAWLAEKSGPPVPPPTVGRTGTEFAPGEDAPGQYVLMK